MAQADKYDWTPDAVATLLSRRAKGHSYGDISREIGASRSACIGKDIRLHSVSASGLSNPLRGAPYAPPCPGLGAADDPASPINQAASSRPFGPATLMDIGRRGCRFPLGDIRLGDGDRALFCGEPAVPGVSYCPTHCRVALTSEGYRKAQIDTRSAGGA